MLAHHVSFQHTFAIRNNLIRRFSMGVKSNVVEVMQHLQHSFRPSCLIAISHHGEDHIFGHHAGVGMLGIPVLP
jgi:hypothetical protein